MKLEMHSLEDLVGNGGLEELIFSMVAGARRQIGFDFDSAHYNYDISKDIPQRALNEVIELIMLSERGHYPSEPTMQGHSEEVIAHLLREETTLDVNENRIKYMNGSTRDTINNLLTNLSNHNEGEIALPLPNWRFWRLSGASHDYKFAYFNAVNEDRLVENFRRLVQKKKISSLLLVNPANPLLYSLSESAAKKIDRIALKHDVEIIIDEVLRGTQPIGKRDSIARYFTRPYVVEGVSKRFGEGGGNPLQRVSYILTPDKSIHIPQSSLTKETRFVRFLEAKMLEVAFRYSTKHAIDELEKRNQAFDEGLAVHKPEATIIRPYTSSLISLLELPKDSVSSKDIDLHTYKKGIKVVGIESFFPGDNYPKPRGLKNLIRVTVGNMNAERIYEGAKRLGYEISTLQRGI